MHSVPPHFLSGGKLGNQLWCSVVPGTAGCRHPLPNSTNCSWSFQGPYLKGLRSDEFGAGQVDRRSRTCSLTSHCEWGERANKCRPVRLFLRSLPEEKSAREQRTWSLGEPELLGAGSNWQRLSTRRMLGLGVDPGRPGTGQWRVAWYLYDSNPLVLLARRWSLHSNFVDTRDTMASRTTPARF